MFYVCYYVIKINQRRDKPGNREPPPERNYKPLAGERKKK